MNFRVNVDKPTTSATVHRVNDNPHCQPGKIPKKCGYWTDPVATREEAIQAAKESGLRIHYCGTCHPEA